MKVKDIMQYRNQGMELALKIVKESGIEGLEKEIAYRGRTGLALTVTKKEISKVVDFMGERSANISILIALLTLKNEFCFSKLQANKFYDRFTEITKDMVLGDKGFEQEQEEIKKEYGIEINISEFEE